MFDDLIRTLKSLDGMKVSVPAAVQADKDGYIDRQCPATECEFLFKVHEDDWRNVVRDEAVWCPFCGHEGASDKWWTHEEIERAKEAAFAEVKHQVNRAMRTDAERWNRRQPRNSFISMTMKVDAKPKEIVLPAAASDPMQLRIGCSQCACRYAVIGSAYFCPACGHNAAEHVFAQSLATIRATLDNLALIAGGLPDRDTAENTTRLLIEDSLQRIVTAFQRYAEALFARLPAPPKARRNVFQNLTEGSALWLQAFGNGYDAHLDAGDLATLNRYFHQRHLLAHRDGSVDADYISRTGDTSYREGQRLVIRESAVRDALTLVERLAAGLAADAARPPKP
ncbi:RNA polymerase subunit RPABC4/transcription elongation factor Spt4 [Bradyrhizobium liaoningense]